MSDPTIASTPPAAPEACPPPLAWQEVLVGVEQQGEAFEVLAGPFHWSGTILGDGPALWFLGGFSGDRRLFSLIAWLLRDRFRCILADFTWNEAPRPAEFLPLLATSVSDALSTLRIDRCHFFGNSVGGQLALAMARQNPNQVGGAILHAAFANRRLSMTERLLTWGARHSGKSLGEFPNWPQLQEANHRRWFPPIDPSRWEFLLSNLGATPAARWGELNRAASRENLWHVLPGIQTPVQLIRTEGDGPVVTAGMNRLMVSLPNVREEELHTTGHYAFLTHPHRVAKIVAGFLAGVA